MKLAKLTPADQRSIQQWPRYGGREAVFNYALGEGGWLADFPDIPGNHRFAAWDGESLVGFSILTETGLGDAEFYVAVRADLIWQGYGRMITASTIGTGFDSLHLQRIHLKVRKWHVRAIQLYASLGFKIFGEKEILVNNSSDLFVLMEIFPGK